MPREYRHIHLRAAAAALGLGAVLLAVVFGIARHLENRYFDALVPQTSALKNQGLFLQRQAFVRSGILPLYGSSELVKSISDKASIFFKRYPTDFTVSPVGKAGTTSLIVAEKLAAVGPQLRGRKVAVSLSPSFFFTHALNSRAYAGNFSPLLASEGVFASELSPELRRDLARRMAQFPATLRSRPLLNFAVKRLSADTPRDRLLYRLALPFGLAANAVVRVQDDLETGLYIAAHARRLKTPPRRETALSWDRLVELWESRSTPFRPRGEDRVIKADKPISEDADFVAAIERSTEWADLELLLRTLRELGAQPLILSIPINGVYFDQLGVTAAARQRYYDLLEAVGQREHVAVVDFRDHELDAKFFADTHDHLSPKGWIYFDEALDEFFHDRPFSFVSR
ncbi:MAG: D-alanine transfer protein [Chthoniobacter sp.]|nr:D-alanine transfer protein [Chthoniobacter sp.]